MGLSITVGILADLLQNDEEGAVWIADHFSEINNVLTKSGFRIHQEPTDCKVWGVDGYGYSGLHALREVAGLVWQNHPIPRDEILAGQDTVYADKLFDAALPFILEEERGGWFSRFKPKKFKSPPLPFMHLVVHSDAEGYYVPVDFPLPLAPTVFRDETASIWPLGSVQRLSQEMDILIEHLEIPKGIHSHSEIFAKLLEEKNLKGNGGVWEAQPIAAYSALILREACEKSMKTGAAISFG